MEQAFLDEHRDRARGGRAAAGRLWLETALGLLDFARRDQWATTRDDLRQTIRGWRRSPLGSGVLVGTIAAGLAAVVTAFAVVDAVMLRPLAVPDPTTLVRVAEAHRDHAAFSNTTYATFLDLSDRVRSLEHVAASRFTYLNLTGEGSPERLLGALVSGSFFDALGVPPVVGRLLSESDDHPGASGAVVLSERYWRSRFGGDPSIVGRRLTLNGQPCEVVGILPAGAVLPLGTDVWSPLAARGGGLEANRRFHGLFVIARLAPSATPDAARAELSTLAAAISAADPAADPDLGLTVQPVLDQVIAPVRPALWITMTATLLLLAVLGTNVAQVQLARAAGRQREFAVRAALGASRGRLARLLLTESVALSLAGGLAGLVLAWWLIGALPAWLPATLPRASGIVFDWRVAALGLGLALAVGVVVGCAPALRTRGFDRLRGARTLGVSQGSARPSSGRLLSSAQLAVTFALIVAAGLVVRSAIAAARVPLGFAADGLVRADVSLSPGRVANPADGDAYAGVFDPLLRRLEAIPGVTRAGLTTTAPLSGGAATSFAVVGDPSPGDTEPSADIRIVDPGYFQVMRIPLVSGRYLTSDDRPGGPPVMVISETLARRHFPGGLAVGRSITMLHWGPPLTAEVVGVVGDVVGQHLERPLNPTIYWHYPQFPQLFALSLFVRTERDAAATVPDVRRAIWDLEPNMPLSRVEPMTTSLATARAQRTTVTTLLVSLASAAAVFALVGLYGVLAQKAARELPAHGVRVALGARGRDIARLVVFDALRLVAAGIAIGVGLMLSGARLVEGLLFQTPARDATSIAAAGLLMLAAALTAAIGPAWRAARVDPTVVMRGE
jgi:predicted permease